MARENWSDRKNYGLGMKYLVFIGVCIIVMLAGVRWLGRLGGGQKAIGQYKREDTGFHTLPAAPRVLVNLEEQAAIDDTSIYAKNEALEFMQYSDYYYGSDLLTAEADYDKDGRLISQMQWEYDVAGNLLRERTESEADGVWERRCIYEYDDAGDVVHQRVYWNEKVVEDNYFRHTDIGRAGISFSYLDDRLEGGISDYCSGRMEFLEDEEGKLRCMFNFSTAETEHSKDASKIQWVQQGDCLISREQFYGYAGYSTRSDWYQNVGAADWEQFNLYEYDAGTKKRNHVLQVNYEWLDEQDKFELSPSFYRARYDGDYLLWQMEYTDGILSYYTVCQYDGDGRAQTGVEYWVEEEEPCVIFYRFEYPRFDRMEKYSYDILGPEFTQAFGEGESVLLTFSDEGILTGIEMTDAAGNVSEKYGFRESGEDTGSIEEMYVGRDVLTGEKEVLSRLEAEVEAYGFRAGEDLESGSSDT